MKRPVAEWRVHLSDHVAFFSYRWIAWGVAALTLTIPVRPAESLPRDAGLLLLLGVINVLATALAQSYVRLLRRRPLVLSLDLAASAAVLWLSQSQTLPFLPYALGALVLPALIFGWRGALLSALSFIGLDVLGLLTFNQSFGATLAPPDLGFRLLTPLIFTAAWIGLRRVVEGEGDIGRGYPRPLGEAGTAGIARSKSNADPSAPTLRLTDLQPSIAPGESSANLASAGQAIAMRITAEQHPATRRVVYDLPPTPEIGLAAALERLGTLVAHQSGLNVQVSCKGTARRLHAAQHAVLLRAAQEALQNVQQHARARRAVVLLTFEPHSVSLTVEDDGVGLLDGTYERPGLHGLRAVRYRLAEFDGQLDVFEGEHGGVTVHATLPLDA
ncbi:MAG: sensor histidine kinase [Chloroflexaceae bacterium]